jgi:hypothetical protein
LVEVDAPVLIHVINTSSQRSGMAALDAEDDIEVVVSHDLVSAEASGLPLQPIQRGKRPDTKKESAWLSIASGLEG